MIGDINYINELNAHPVSGPLVLQRTRNAALLHLLKILFSSSPLTGLYIKNSTFHCFLTGKLKKSSLTALPRIDMTPTDIHCVEEYLEIACLCDGS